MNFNYAGIAAASLCVLSRRRWTLRTLKVLIVTSNYIQRKETIDYVIARVLRIMLLFKFK